LLYTNVCSLNIYFLSETSSLWIRYSVLTILYYLRDLVHFPISLPKSEQQALRGSNTSSSSITKQQLAKIINNLKEEWRKEVEEENKNLQEAWRRKVEEENKHSLEIIKQELKEAIKIELTQIASQHSPPVEAPNIQVLATRVSTKGSCVGAYTNPLGKEPSDVHVATVGLYVVGDQCTRLVALGKVYDNASIIHNVPCSDDVVRVSVVTVYDDDTQVPFFNIRDSVCEGGHWHIRGMADTSCKTCI